MILTSICLALAFQSAPLSAGKPVLVPGGPGGFDFMNVDAENRLILAAHPKLGGFAVLDLKTGKAKEIACYAVNGICADSKGHRVFAAGPDKKFVVFDSKSWKKLGELSLDGPGDCVQFDTKHGVVYVDNDDGTSLWRIDPSKPKLTATVTIKEAPEYMELDAKTGQIFQAIKTSSSVQIVDLKSNKVTAEWTLDKLTSPHGLAYDPEFQKVFVVGKNGILDVLLANHGGAKEGDWQSVKNSDQIAYDRGLKRLYIPGSGQMEVVAIGKTGMHTLGTVPVPKGCHSVTVDPKTHTVWIAYTDDKNSYLQPYSVK